MGTVIFHISSLDCFCKYFTGKRCVKPARQYYLFRHILSFGLTILGLNHLFILSLIFGVQPFCTTCKSTRKEKGKEHSCYCDYIRPVIFYQINRSETDKKQSPRKNDNCC